MTPTVRLACDERRFLVGHLRRLTGWDHRCAVRVLTRGSSLAVLGTTPMDALSFVAVPMADDAGSPALDLVVSAADLLDRLEQAATVGEAGDAVVAVDLPLEHVPVADLAVLPPEGPWIPAQRATAGDVAPLVAAALDRFRAEATGPESAEDVAERLWDERTWGGLPLRALHAARALGFLSRGAGRVEAATCAGWKRLRTPAGQVFVRPVGAAARLTLSVLS